MKRVALVVEGLGDRKAFPSLVAKTAQIFGQQAYVVNIVEGGGWGTLKSPGEFERNCILASLEGNPDEVIVVIDLDDDCAKLEFQNAQARINDASAAAQMPVQLCFCVREYETWFLEGLEGIIANSPEIEWKAQNLTAAERSVRAAKEAFERALGQSYRQSIDQDKFTKRLNLKELLSKSRSYRKFAKSLVRLDYADFPV